VQVFGANPFSLTKLRLQARDGAGKVAEGVGFMTRGLRLLSSDVGNAGRLFSKAALGGTLKPREVRAARGGGGVQRVVASVGRLAGPLDGQSLAAQLTIL
jgi:hypothetical protein